MRPEALYHRSSGCYAYPVGADRMRLVLQAARGDLSAVRCRFGDRYRDPVEDTTAPLAVAAADDRYDYWTVTLPVPSRRLRYCFHVESQGASVWLGDRGATTSQERCAWYHYPYINPADAFRLPDWLSGAVIYQVFPDRFANGNPANDPPGTRPWGSEPDFWTFTGGDLEGIAQNLSWLEALGARCLYLTPVFRSPSCHRYDTTDYYQVEPTLGTREDLLALTESAHSRGMRVMLDVAFNHSGTDFFAFADVRANGSASAYAPWYNIDSFPVRLERPGCNYETFAHDAYEMPKLMTQVPAVREYLLGVTEHWTRTVPLDGWRLDVANEIDHQFWREFRRRVKAINPDALILGEVWNDALPWLGGDQYDSVTHYPWREVVLDFLNGHLDVDAFDAQLVHLRFRYPGAATGGLVHLLGSHDTPRVLTALGGSRAKAMMAAVLLFTAQGVPLVYYGDEIGMEGENDPECRRCMVWEAEGQDRELLALYRKLGRMRRSLPWLNTGEWRTLLTDSSKGLYAYERSGALAANAAPVGQAADDPHQRIWVILNASNREETVPIPAAAGMVDLLDQSVADASGLRLPAWGATVLAPASLSERLVEA